MKRKRQAGFTFIEVLIALAVIAILFVPVMRLFSDSAMGTAQAVNYITATNLAKWQMEKTRNLTLSKKDLIKMGSDIYPPMIEEPLRMNNSQWRIHREFVPDTDPLEVRVSVYQGSEIEGKPLCELVTLFEDMSWEEVTPIQ